MQTASCFLHELLHNLYYRPPEETLKILQSLGGIQLRYSMTPEHDKWIILGYKGEHKVDWITEKVGKTGENAIRIASTVSLKPSMFLDGKPLSGIIGIYQALITTSSSPKT